jgi:hypothetical protein
MMEKQVPGAGRRSLIYPDANFSFATSRMTRCGEFIGRTIRASPAAVAMLLLAPGHAAESVPAAGAIRNLAKPTDAELKAFLTPEPRKTPTEALRTFETARGFHLE